MIADFAGELFDAWEAHERAYKAYLTDAARDLLQQANVRTSKAAADLRSAMGLHQYTGMLPWKGSLTRDEFVAEIVRRAP